MTPHRAVYDGQTRLGSVEQRDREFIARNRVPVGKREI